MPVRASVEPLPEPGHAILRVSELDAAPDGLALSIQRQQGPDSHLADDGWRRTEAWLLPERVERRRDALEFHLGPEICDRLAGIATVRVRVKEPDIGVVGTTVVAWPAMLTSGALDPSSRAVRRHGAPAPPPSRSRAAAPPPEPEPEPAPEPPAPPFTPPPPRPELRASRALDPGPPERSSRAGWLIAALVLVAARRAAAITSTRPTSRSPSPWSRRRRLRPRRRPSRPRARRASRCATSSASISRPSPRPRRCSPRRATTPRRARWRAAFLVFRRAAETGNAPAQLELATFYDPLSTPAQGGLHARRRARRRLVRARGARRLGRGAAQARPAARQGRRRPAGRSGQGQDLAAAGGGAERRRRQEGAGRPAEVAGTQIAVRSCVSMSRGIA